MVQKRPRWACWVWLWHSPVFRDGETGEWWEMMITWWSLTMILTWWLVMISLWLMIIDAGWWWSMINTFHIIEQGCLILITMASHAAIPYLVMVEWCCIGKSVFTIYGYSLTRDSQLASAVVIIVIMNDVLDSLTLQNMEQVDHGSHHSGKYLRPNSLVHPAVAQISPRGRSFFPLQEKSGDVQLV